jgi:hypothetical protein
VSKLNGFIKMSQNKIFIWLAEEMLKGAFIEWLETKGESGISYPTLGRAQERQYVGERLTHRQEKAERLARQFREEILAKRQQCHAQAA